MTWTIERTETFLEALKVHKKNAALIHALNRKITRLQEDPASIAGWLAGQLHRWRSTRLIKNFRLLFRIDTTGQRVILGAIDHRKDIYG
jgi:mRNA-degrading endonuclease RelE of RelBE toxin-antitoxin system